VRPEFIRVSAAPPGEGPNVFQGQVASLVFVGEAYEGEISIGETRLITEIDPTSGIGEGDAVFIAFDADQCTLLMG
jgi:iron(III) transport system ATP-binding protein